MTDSQHPHSVPPSQREAEIAMLRLAEDRIAQHKAQEAARWAGPSIDNQMGNSRNSGAEFGNLCDYDPTGLCNEVEKAGEAVAELAADAVSKQGFINQYKELIILIGKDPATSFVVKTTLSVLSVGFSDIIISSGSEVVRLYNAARDIAESAASLVPPEIQKITKGSTLLNLMSSGVSSWTKPWIEGYTDGIFQRMGSLGSTHIHLEGYIQQGTINATTDLSSQLMRTASPLMGGDAVYMNAVMSLKDFVFTKEGRKDIWEEKDWLYDKLQESIDSSPLMKLSPAELAVALNLSRIDCALEARALATGRKSDLDAWKVYINTDWTYGKVRHYYDPLTGNVLQDPSEEQLRFQEAMDSIQTVQSQVQLQNFAKINPYGVAGQTATTASPVAPATVTKKATSNSGITKDSPAPLALGAGIVGAGIAVAAGAGLVIAAPIGLGIATVLWFLKKD